MEDTKEEKPPSKPKRKKSSGGKTNSKLELYQPKKYKCDLDRIKERMVQEWYTTASVLELKQLLGNTQNLHGMIKMELIHMYRMKTLHQDHETSPEIQMLNRRSQKHPPLIMGSKRFERLSLDVLLTITEFLEFQDVASWSRCDLYFTVRLSCSIHHCPSMYVTRVKQISLNNPMVQRNVTALLERTCQLQKLQLMECCSLPELFFNTTTPFCMFEDKLLECQFFQTSFVFCELFHTLRNCRQLKHLMIWNVTSIKTYECCHQKTWNTVGHFPKVCFPNLNSLRLKYDTYHECSYLSKLHTHMPHLKKATLGYTIRFSVYMLSELEYLDIRDSEATNSSIRFLMLQNMPLLTTIKCSQSQYGFPVSILSLPICIQTLSVTENENPEMLVRASQLKHITLLNFIIKERFWLTHVFDQCKQVETITLQYQRYVPKTHFQDLMLMFQALFGQMGVLHRLKELKINTGLENKKTVEDLFANYQPWIQKQLFSIVIS